VEAAFKEKSVLEFLFLNIGDIMGLALDIKPELQESHDALVKASLSLYTAMEALIVHKYHTSSSMKDTSSSKEFYREYFQGIFTHIVSASETNNEVDFIQNCEKVLSAY
jgi:hypothetical protein